MARATPSGANSSGGRATTGVDTRMDTFRSFLEGNITAYHGTAAEFDGFRTEPEEMGTLWSGDPGAGMLGPFFTEDPEVAATYPKFLQQGETRRVVAASLDIRNPKRFRTLKALHEDMREFGKTLPPEGFKLPPDAARRLARAYKDHLRSKGHDGVTFLEGPSWRPGKRGAQARVWVPFSNDQIGEIEPTGA